MLILYYNTRRLFSKPTLQILSFHDSWKAMYQHTADKNSNHDVKWRSLYFPGPGKRRHLHNCSAYCVHFLLRAKYIATSLVLSLQSAKTGQKSASSSIRRVTIIPASILLDSLADRPWLATARPPLKGSRPTDWAAYYSDSELMRATDTDLLLDLSEEENELPSFFLEFRRPLSMMTMHVAWPLLSMSLPKTF